MSAERCDTCRFWVPKGTGGGKCCRRSPVRIDADLAGSCGGRAYALWPETYYADWCGEYESNRGEA